MLQKKANKQTNKQNKTKQDEGLVECDKLLIHLSFLQQAQTNLSYPNLILFNGYTHENQKKKTKQNKTKNKNKQKKNAKVEFLGQFDSNSIALCLSFSRIQEKIQHCSLWSDSIHIMRHNSANHTTNTLKFENEVFLGHINFYFHLMPSKKISK